MNQQSSDRDFSGPPPEPAAPCVGLFVTCLVDLFRPSVGFAAVKLLEATGCKIVVPREQTCCGQPAYNSGDRKTARSLALQTIEAFKDCDYVVAPSGSCAGMLKSHYPSLLADDPSAHDDALRFAAKVYELISFLSDVRGMVSVPGAYTGTVTYHDSCSGLRELGIKDQPRRLLKSVEGLELVEMAECETCCGFGGTFSVKFPDISNAMVERKTTNISASQAPLLLAGDLGCLMNIAGKLSRQGSPVGCRHIAEVLAGELSDPVIAAPSR
ncbi:putative hydroxyacid oxidoreductase (Fe-S centre) [Candidatus Filomicrobium marinum]|uniref:L-lactate dehydrogenase complex protein LldE n=2 Tax=Filomicrobium TaxID=119044 RepID=A0A1H0LUR6_9HYPH|nr:MULTISPECIES: (Fe-S)-binding protein [Filomicrobium]MCV0368741.1 (Fe-S)-binding protein [Filomicrobium sp.]CFW99250.1 putative hydroxyacid oxidoreductase (Fe-S centre) [Candidatus Filomicrobium marinum]CPR15025.1 putative hydroxyacid oxidoreductase (Fe-S centre) [Candidatus Filomicrobium marinum]SDO71706.1 L-lactate dehydrogenase complex protein LldE [Filomicrobium insigne]